MDLSPILPTPIDRQPPPLSQRGRADQAHHHHIPFLDDVLEYSPRKLGEGLDLNMCTEIPGSESGDSMVDYSDDGDGDNASRIIPSPSDSTLPLRTPSSSDSTLLLRTASSSDSTLLQRTPSSSDSTLLLRTASSSNSTLLQRTAPSILREQRLTMADFRPMLSTLNRYGRPRFIRKKVTMSGGQRLLISMEVERSPRLVSPSGEDSGQSKKLVLSYNTDSDQDDHTKEESEDDRMVTAEVAEERRGRWFFIFSTMRRETAVDATAEEGDQRSWMRRDFPPLLSTLKENGRPRLAMRKVTSDGRLMIFMEEDLRPAVDRQPEQQEDEAISMIYSFVEDQTQLFVHGYFS